MAGAQGSKGGVAGKLAQCSLVEEGSSEPPFPKGTLRRSAHFLTYPEGIWLGRHSDCSESGTLVPLILLGQALLSVEVGGIRVKHAEQGYVPGPWALSVATPPLPGVWLFIWSLLAGAETAVHLSVLPSFRLSILLSFYPLVHLSI